VILTVWVLLSAGLDAGGTLLPLQQGGSEGNPLMALALSAGATPFVWITMLLSGVGVRFLAAHQGFPLAARALSGIALGSLALVLSHGVLLLHQG
jgi:hypothetical protein